MESGRPGGSQPRGRSGSKALPATRSLHPCRAMYDCFAFKKVSRLLLVTAQGTGVPEAVASTDAPLSHRPTSTHRSFPLQREKISRNKEGKFLPLRLPFSLITPAGSSRCLGSRSERAPAVACFHVSSALWWGKPNPARL